MLPCHPGPDSDNAEALLAGTLCLMSCATQSGTALYAQKIALNLDRLAGHTGLSAELRTICRRLADHWERQADQQAQGSDGAPHLHEVLRAASRVH